MALWLGILEKAEQKGYICLEKMQYQYPVSGTVGTSAANENCLTLQEEFEIISMLHSALMFIVAWIKNDSLWKRLGI